MSTVTLPPGFGAGLLAGTKRRRSVHGSRDAEIFAAARAANAKALADLEALARPRGRKSAALDALRDYAVRSGYDGDDVDTMMSSAWIVFREEVEDIIEQVSAETGIPPPWA